jgi:hypothetical protein
MKTIIHFWTYLPQFFLEWDIFFSDKSYRANQNTYFRLNNSFFFCFRKSCRLWDNVEKYCGVGQATDDNVAHDHCMLDTQGYKSALRICSYVLLFLCNNGYMNAPQCYVIRKLRVLLNPRVLNLLIKPSRIKSLIRALCYGRRCSSGQFYRTLKLSVFQIARYHSPCCNKTENIK